MKTEDLLKLYQLVLDEEHHYNEAHQSRIAFHMGLITAIFTGIGAGFFLASDWYHFLALCSGPVLIFFVARNAEDATHGLYQRFLEAVTVRAKIEQELGLTEPRSSAPDSPHTYWASEPITPSRHIATRSEYGSSREFVDAYSRRGYHGKAMRLFRWSRWLGGVMVLGLLTLTIWMAL
jgi:hypothetical protein